MSEENQIEIKRDICKHCRGFIVRVPYNIVSTFDPQFEWRWFHLHIIPASPRDFSQLGSEWCPSKTKAEPEEEQV